MESLIETFHIDAKLLLAQIINFAVVFFVLYFFALKPLLGVMRERTKNIEKSLDDAKEIENTLNQTKAEYSIVIAGAKKEANKIIEKAAAAAEGKKKEIIDRAKEEVGQIINQEKAKIQAEKAKTLKEIKMEVADLVAVSLEKILGEKVDAKKDKEIIKQVIRD